MKDETMTRRTMYWPDELWARAQEVAARADVPAAQYVREAVELRVEIERRVCREVEK